MVHIFTRSLSPVVTTATTTKHKLMVNRDCGYKPGGAVAGLAFIHHADMFCGFTGRIAAVMTHQATIDNSLVLKPAGGFPGIAGDMTGITALVG